VGCLRTSRTGAAAFTRGPCAGNECGDFAVTAISSSLRGNAAITSLDLSCTLGVVAAAALPQSAMRINVSFPDNNVGDAGATALSESFKVNSVIRDVQLRGARMGRIASTTCVNMISGASKQETKSRWRELQRFRERSRETQCCECRPVVCVCTAAASAITRSGISRSLRAHR
jgi:hypothetical protein